MMLIDSNIIIYAARPEHAGLREFIAEHTPSVSAVSFVEVLGYHALTGEERRLFEAFFAAASILNLSWPVLEQAVRLRQLRRMTSGGRARCSYGTGPRTHAGDPEHKGLRMGPEPHSAQPIRGSPFQWEHSRFLR
jgi:hypothetical protein